MRFIALTFAVVAALSGLASAHWQIELTPCAQDCAFNKCGGPVRACVCGNRRSDIDSCVESTCREGHERSQAQESVRVLCGGRLDVKEGSGQAPIVEQQEA
ncbi:hypothetical protein K523DRAFT_355536 [Schizophyllum commune Tattone D]|nr:hypothetical protein K523DRAFT_355536 [Schizophyllum commune Tattone D]